MLPHINVMQAGASCRPLMDLDFHPACNYPPMDFIFREYLLRHPPDGVFLAAQWRLGDLDSLGRTISWLHAHNIPVVVLGPMPEYDSPLPRLEAYAVAWNIPSMPANHLVPQQRLLDDKMQMQAAAVWRVPYVSLYRAICPDDKCVEYSDAAHTVPLMFDTNHLTLQGSMLVTRSLEGQLTTAAGLGP
jgi:hypothetical protein